MASLIAANRSVALIAHFSIWRSIGVGRNAVPRPSRIAANRVAIRRGQAATPVAVTLQNAARGAGVHIGGAP